MMTRRTIMAMLASAPGLTLGACGGRKHFLRYRLSLEVATPEGVRSGSSVVEVALRHQFVIGAGELLHRDLRGEAAVVDLGPRGPLFCLLVRSGGANSRSADELFQAGFPTKSEGIEDFLTQVDQLQARKGRAELQPAQLPMLVRFRDIADPKTVERVDPNDLAKSFGPGVRLKRATIEITDDAVTRGIEKRLGWLKTLVGSIGKDMNLPYRDLLNIVNDGSFRQGIDQ